MTREPAVAGKFYPAEEEGLRKEIFSRIPVDRDKSDVIGAVVPHAGYIYSGDTAGSVYATLRPENTFILIGPNHSGMGTRFALSTEDWKMPMGNVAVDNDLIEEILSSTDLIEEDNSAHIFEHSLEVQVPFIQAIAPEAKIVPLIVQDGSRKEYLEVAESIAAAVRETGTDTVVIASTDMTHYESRESAQEKDRMAIDMILDLDPEGLLNTVEGDDISMCGYIPTAIMLMYANSIGAVNAELIEYTDSGAVSGDTDQVVGYAGMIVT